MTRPRTLVFVAGTGTEVGKTWWTAAVARELRGAGRDGRGAQAGAVGRARRHHRRRPARRRHRRGPRHRVPRAPHATPSRGRRPWPPTSWDCRRSPSPTSWASSVWPDGVAVGLVEGVGGPRSPIAADGDNVDFARALAPDLVVLVADAGLGTINAVRLSVAAFDGFPVVVALNRYAASATTRCTPATATLSPTIDGLDVVTDALAARGAASATASAAGMTAPLVVGVPRERKSGEHRVAITPDGVHELAVHGVTVLVEDGAGAGSSHHRRRLPRRRRRDRRRRRPTCGRAPASC